MLQGMRTVTSSGLCHFVLLGNVKSPDTKTFDRDYDWPTDLMYQKLRTTYAKDSHTTKGRLMIHPETTDGSPTTNPLRGRYSVKSTIWANKAKEDRYGKKRGKCIGKPEFKCRYGCHAVIVCDEKLVQVPYRNETFTFCSNESNNGRESRLTVISCSKAQEYMAKGCQVFLAQISAKKEEDKSEGKQIKDVPIVRDFPEVFP
ncbi:hypothetical protein Tco_0412716 [Tanacetum coccineum]